MHELIIDCGMITCTAHMDPCLWSNPLLMPAASEDSNNLVVPRSNHLARTSTILAMIMQARSHNLGRIFLYFLLILQDVHAKCPFSCISCKKIVKILHAKLARKLARFLFLARNLARSLLSCKKFCKI